MIPDLFRRLRRHAEPVDPTVMRTGLPPSVVRAQFIKARYNRLRSGMLAYPEEKVLVLALPRCIASVMKDPQSIRQVISGLEEQLEQIENMNTNSRP